MNGLLPFDMYYENSAGETVRLDRPPFVVTGGRLFDSSWKMTLAQRPLGEGGSLLARRRPTADRTLTVQAAASSAGALSAAMDSMTAVFDYDIEQRVSGRLWINGSYMRCWCSGRTKELSCDLPGQGKITLSVTPEHPAWCTEYRYRLVGGAVVSDSGGHRYPYGYPRRYGTSRRTVSLVNRHFAPSPMRITLYGPSLEPRIYVSGMCIGVNTPLQSGERVIIDQQNRLITRIAADGTASSGFGDRIKNGSVFSYAPPGSSTVDLYNDTLGADIVLIEQRSEPSWSRD